ncbi:hypothetical protein [Mycetohabitans endofungorum]|uniref:hypothetical protein n=1 Tax=Mycetohabitans endofungorum TaxID=417203 RepID=UPI00396A9DF1
MLARLDHSPYCIDGQAANLLRPIADEAALLLFSASIIGCEMLAISHLCGQRRLYLC